MRKLFVLGRMASSFGATSFQVSTHCRIIPRSSILQSSTSRAWSGYTEHSFMDGARIYETEIAIDGGGHMIGTPHQKRLRIHDSPALAWRDWQSVADYDLADDWPRAWGRFYCENSREYIFEFLDRKKIAFLPLVNWPERGLYAPGNTVPRWHIVWGTGYEIIHRLLDALESHPQRANLELLFDTEVSAIEMTGGRATGVVCRKMEDGREIGVAAGHV